MKNCSSMKSSTETKTENNQTVKWPIVYHSKYNVKFFGFEKLHPFDASKWGNVIEYLKQEKLLTNESLNIPEEIQKDELLKIHTKKYLNSLNWSFRVAAVAEMPILAFLPNIMLQRMYLQCMRYQVGGSVLASKLAMKHGWAINIGGGFHHCSKGRGGGFCPYADITILIHSLFEDSCLKVQKAMIIDLDAHQGNGHERDFKEDERVFILDAYNVNIYPNDKIAEEGINRAVELSNYTADSEYLPLIEKYIEKSLNKFHPDIIVYNAGTDILEGDPLGKLCVTANGIIERDKIVFMKARERRIPIVMLTSGGYLKCTAKIIADSILNLADLGLISSY
ncbi:histone deacetylase 11 [Planococcus citri]|uniref:histone deacetylase 11 n=1 Tax=Planococcus citri TaxID=170843 RepID=UPI0031F9E597